jgi:Fe-S oxidoreductase
LNRWYPEALKEFKICTVFDLLLDYIKEGKIQVDTSVHPQKTVYHDPCNYGRKSLKAFGQAYFEEGREVMRACCPDTVDMEPNRETNYCCGAGGGAWAMPFSAERIYYGRAKARQLTDCEAEMVIAPCHNCRDQLKKSLNQEYDLNIKVKYLWELVADSLILPAVEKKNEE